MICCLTMTKTLRQAIVPIEEEKSPHSVTNESGQEVAVYPAEEHLSTQ